MNDYRRRSNAYDLLDTMYFSEKGKNPREAVLGMIPNEKICVLDLCCGTLSNSIPIAKERPDIQIVGLDLSEEMLRVAKMKIMQLKLENIALQCADATRTGLPDKSVDCVILGLVLHESSPGLIKGILREAGRVLKDDGSLIVLEWEQPKGLYQAIKFAPLYWMERLNCNTFKQFFRADKAAFFEEYGFCVERAEHCSYTIVLQLKKR